MTDQEKIDRVRDWDRQGPEGNACVIFCHPQRNGTATCELCGARVKALPESRVIASRPGWHIVCMHCHNLLAPHFELKIEGRFKTSAQACKILPMD